MIHGHLLHRPVEAGHSYHNAYLYMSIVLAISGLTLEEITGRVEMAKRHVLQSSDQIYLSYEGNIIINDAGVVRHLDAFSPLCVSWDIRLSVMCQSSLKITIH